MSKVLLVGNCPLPNENSKSRPAAGLRTFQFWKGLKEANNKVLLVAIAMPECYKDIKEAFENADDRRVISKDDPKLFDKLQAIHDEFRPDAIVSVNTHPSYSVSKLKSNVPMWADLNGWVMAEGQAQAFKKNSNDYLAHYWGMEKSIIRRADKFSSVSIPQSHTLLGELAAMGRLNRETFGYDFVEAIANGTEWFAGEKDVKEATQSVPKDSFVLLWMGGYNTWVDEETLFKGIEGAMKKNEKIYFISTGGKVKGLDNKTFSRFKEMIDESVYKDRFVFLGWVKTEIIPAIYKEADLGLNVDRKCVETTTGARNRINEMMKFGLPVVTTLGSEIAEEVERIEAGIAVDSGDNVALSEAILKLAKKSDGELEEFGKNGQNYIKEECNYKKLTAGVAEWTKNAKRAPDAGMIVNVDGGKSLKMAWRYLRENGLRKFLSKLFQ